MANCSDDINPFLQVEPLLVRKSCDKNLESKYTEENDQKKILIQQNMALKRNITCLYKTAKLEIQRCEEKITTLQSYLRSCPVATKQVKTSDAHTQTTITENQQEATICLSCKTMLCFNKDKKKDTKDGTSAIRRKGHTCKEQGDISRCNSKKRKSTQGIIKSPKKTKVRISDSKSVMLENKKRISYGLEDGEILSSDDGNTCGHSLMIV